MKNFIRSIFVGFGCYLSVKVITHVGISLASYNEPLLLLTLITNAVGYMVVFSKLFDGALWLVKNGSNENQGL
ncbi:hypothetical protein VST7929_02940 [Vibrio stylophorae]|uniref:Uncharacterized protein n=1 Tax=Vibrio stylophorae TaxID=659351 RepID=A0ABN8DXD3_9VIBR|nr:hypothetical protein [Vibrio stylophorae]CAH0535350.1 hypothetical protein VST7929_02940 [Vibrio stylophorae]